MFQTILDTEDSTDLEDRVAMQWMVEIEARTQQDDSQIMIIT